MSKIQPVQKQMSLPKGLSNDDDSWSEGRPSRQKQRVSKVTSKFFRNSLTEYKEDGNDSFRIPAHQIDAITRNLERKEKKIAHLWYALIIAVLFAIGTPKFYFFFIRVST